MIELLERLAFETTRDSVFLRSSKLDELRPAVLNPEAKKDLVQWFWLNYELGMEEYSFGTIEGAIQRLETARDLLVDPTDPDHKMLRSRLAYYLGMAYLRQGERENCVGHHTAQSCIFPIQEGGVHKVQGGSRRAIEYFAQALDETAEKTYEYVAAQWLLNIAYMTVGAYPDEVPDHLLIEPSFMASEATFPRFNNISHQAGLDAFNLAGGMVVDDFNGDLLPDVVTSSWHPSENIRFYSNLGDGTFEERTEQANLQGLTGGLNMVQADYDNDGDLDLYIGNEATPEQAWPSQLFRNNGAGRFVDVAAEAGVENLRYAKAVVWGDYDEDRWPDIYVSNFHGPNRLYHNLGNGRFEDVGPTLGVVYPGASFPSWFWDFDNDGALDILSNAYPDAEGPVRLFLFVDSYLGLEVQVEPTRLYRGDGKGGFVDVARDRNLGAVTIPMAGNFGDLDNDGYLDFYLATGYPRYGGLMPNALYWNREGVRFDDVTTDGGLGHLQKGHGVAFADFDGDGDQDVFEQLGGFFPLDGNANALFDNPGFGNNWWQVRLVGNRSNRFGIGATLQAELIEKGQSRSIYRTVNSGGSFGANPLTQHIGLGQAKGVRRLRVFWPTSDTMQEFSDLEAGLLIEIVEGNGRVKRLQPPWRERATGGHPHSRE